jgi:hypothetical protein
VTLLVPGEPTIGNLVVDAGGFQLVYGTLVWNKLVLLDLSSPADDDGIDDMFTLL